MNSTTNGRKPITAQEGTMKKTTLFVLAVLAALFAAVPAHAANSASGVTDSALWVTVNTDIRASAEAIVDPTGDAPAQCEWARICHDTTGDDVVRFLESTVPLYGTQKLINTYGATLYPPDYTASTGGDKCAILDRRPKAINPKNFYASTLATTANSVRFECMKKK